MVGNVFVYARIPMVIHMGMDNLHTASGWEGGKRKEQGR